MLKTNEYFDGKVKSIALENSNGKATVGVMETGTYEFGTSSREFMTVVSGKLIALLPEQEEWKEFGQGETFIVEANKKFQVKAPETTAYICYYE